MNTASKSKSGTGGDAPNLPDWQDCDLFCIHDYAGATTPPCGWRGRSREARREAADLTLRCPRCGCATLLRIPLDSPGNTHA